MQVEIDAAEAAIELLLGVTDFVERAGVAIVAQCEN